MPRLFRLICLTLVVLPATAWPAQQPRDSIAGLYRDRAGGLVGIAVLAGGRTIFTDFSTELTGRISVGAAGQLVSRYGAGTITGTVVKSATGRVTGLRWREPDRPERQLERLSFRREEVSFSNGAVKLSGTLVLPAGAGPHPAVVRIHGAGPADRNNTVDEFYASRGVAFLSYDKRGVGASAGDWQKAGVDDLAGDAVAAVRLLGGRRDIDAKRIGVAGGSEGGWVAAAVTGRVPELAFVALLAGPALSFSEEVLNEVDYGLRQRGLSESEVDRGIAFQRRKLELIRSAAVFSDAGWSELQAAADSVRSAPWFPAVQPWPRGFWRYEKYHHMTQFDPTVYWERYRGPLLALYGGKDSNVPAARNVAALRQAMAKAGNSRHRIELVPNADHEGLDPASADGETVRFAPGFLKGPLDWILELERDGGR